MKLKSLRLRNFRAYQYAEVTFEPDVTILVGENNVGKSTINLAIETVIRALQGNLLQLSRDDSRYGRSWPINVSLELSLSDYDRDTIRKILIPEERPNENTQEWLRYLDRQAQIMSVSVTQTAEGAPSETLLWIGDVNLDREKITFRGVSNPTDLNWEATYIHRVPGDISSSRLLHQEYQKIVAMIADNYSSFLEFRHRTDDGAQYDRDTPTETWSGIGIDRRLFNLKESRSKKEREQFAQIQNIFQLLFPNLHLDVYQRVHDQYSPAVMFQSTYSEDVLDLTQMSAGIYEMLVIVTTMMTQSGKVIFVEHPEQHLHPHSSKFLLSFLLSMTKRNQVVIVTHEASYITPDTVHTIRRIAQGPESGAVVYQLSASMTHASDKTSERDWNRILKAVSKPGFREVVFARSVLLVEDQSQEAFILGISGRAGPDLHAASVTVFPVDGHSSFNSYVTFLENLRIPFVCFRDKSWGEADRYPRDQYFSVKASGTEIEDLLRDYGLGNRLDEIMHMRDMTKALALWYLGREIDREQVPPVIITAMNAVVKKAGFDPSREIASPTDPAAAGT